MPASWPRRIAPFTLTITVSERIPAVLQGEQRLAERIPAASHG
jgi:hypothetical protein